MSGVRLLVAFACAIPIACTVENGPGRIAADIPDRTTFTKPGDVLVAKCGSLDCHGDPYRNMRLFGYGGSRLAPSHRPDAPDTTDAELARDYDAVVAVEPERTREVANGHASPEKLTLVRKARGSEKHVGGTRLVPGSPEDTCVVSWLTNQFDDAACTTALAAIAAARQR